MFNVCALLMPIVGQPYALVDICYPDLLEAVDFVNESIIYLSSLGILYLIILQHVIV